VRNPHIFENLPRFLTKMKLGPLEAEFRQLREELEETKQQVDVLEADISHDDERYRSLVEGFDPHAPVADLASTRESLKAMAGSLDDLGPVRRGLAPDASASELYAAAEIARARRDPELYDDLVTCLNRLAGDADLGGIRLHTVWTLTSALHRTLVADQKHGAKTLSPEQLEAGRAMLALLNKNPRVLADKPEAPLKGVRGPAKWAGDWIEKALKALPNTDT
jgi:hypothetical protein